MFFTILAIIPYLDSNKKSFWFFNDIANRSHQSFLEEIDVQTQNEEESDINNQIYYLAKGLKKKHRKIKISLIINMIQFAFLILIAFIII